MRRLISLAGILAATAGAGCTEATVTTPSAIGNNLPMTVEVFGGSLPQGGSRFYSFTVSRTGPASIMLLSLTENDAPSAATVLLGIGVPRGTDCIATTTAVLGTGVVPQLSITADPAIYCARIADAGNLTGPAQFSINIVRPR